MPAERHARGRAGDCRGLSLLRHGLAGLDRRRAALWARRFGFYRRITAHTAPLTGRLLMKQLRYIGLPDALYPLFRQDGYYLLKEHFYRPFTNPDSLPPDYWARRSELAGIAIAADACRRNNVAVPGSSLLICIEPYPTAIVTGGLAHLAELMQTRVEEVDLGFFESLETGDILFIDSSHALREGGDVQFLYCEVLPRLRPGVAIHVHDVSLPTPYSRG